MSIACIDIGNTAIKVVVFPFSGEMVDPKEFASIADVDALLEKEGIQKVAYSTTRHLDENEIRIVSEKDWWELNTTRNLPIKINYETPATLGPDRISAAIGARALYPASNIMIADVGTALTIDIVSSQGEFRGGNISAGIKMRLDALHHYTSRLPLVEWRKVSSPFGEDTPTAMICGATWGVITEIFGCHRIASEKFPDMRLVLTGGGMGMIEEGLRSIMPENIEMENIPNLVAFGLKEAYNHDKEN